MPRPTRLGLTRLEDRATPATFTVTTTADAGPGSLRQALLAANAAAGPDAVAFNIPAVGVQTIQLASQLPLLTGPVTVDGFTQPGATPNTLAVGDNAAILVEVLGGGGAAWAFAQQPGGNLDGSSFRGLALGNFGSAAIAVGTANNVTIAGNFIGLRPDGRTARPNFNGITIEAGSGHVVGGPTPADRNVISGNTGNGLSFTAGGVLVSGNYIGTTAAGTGKLGNGAAGVTFQSSGNVIGGGAPGQGNVISGNSTSGVWARVSSGTTVAGNRIGTDAAGIAALGNGQDGVLFTDAGAGNVIGGASPGAGNVISGNGRNGIALESTAANLIAGNLVGTNAAGTAAVPNVGFGISSSGFATIGGTAAAGNVVSGNSAGGMHLRDGFLAQGNRVGTDVTGVSPVPNGGPGVLIDQAALGTLGNEAGPNTIAFNAGAGVAIQFPAQQYRVGANSVHDNGGPGIVLVGDANGSIKPPTILSAAVSNGQLSVASTFEGGAGSYRLEFFASRPGGGDEGEVYLGASEFTRGPNDPPTTYGSTVAPPPVGFTLITGTLTRLGTSEFSAPFDLAARRNTPPTISDIAGLYVPPGATSAPITFQVADADSPADTLVVTAHSSIPAVVPPSGIVLGGAGGTRTVTITPSADPGKADTTTITLTVTDPDGGSATVSFVVHTRETDTGESGGVAVFPGNTALLNNKKFAVGPDRGGAPVVRYFDQAGTELFSKLVYASSFTGGVRTAAGDVNGDGTPDLVAAAGPGGPPTVVVLDGKSGAELRRFDAFEATFTGGLFVTTADFDRDGCDDLVITPDEGGGPRVMVRSGKDDHTLADFFGIDDPNFRGGCRPAAADVTGDGTPDLLVAAGFGGGPRLAGFDGASVAAGNPVRAFADFFVFEQTLRNGAYVTAGDLNADGYADVIAGGGPGGGPRVLALDGKRVLANAHEPLANFFAGDPTSRGGVRLVVKDLDNDVRADLVTAAGTGDGSAVRRYTGKGLAAAAPTPDAIDDAFPGFAGGVFVG
jgi:hypothetical protein